MSDSQEHVMNKQLQDKFLEVMKLPQDEFAQFMQMNKDHLGEFHKPLDNGLSPAMAILNEGNIKNLNPLFEYAPEDPSKPFVATFGEFQGHNLLDLANLKGETTVANILQNQGYASALAEQSMENASEMADEAKPDEDTAVRENEYQDQIKPVEAEQDELQRQYRPANALEILTHHIKTSLSSAKVNAWKKTRPEATLHEAVANTRAIESRISKLYGEGPLANIMSDIKGLNKTPVELAYAIKSDDLLVKKLDLPGRLAALPPETLQQMGDINRALQDNQSKWKAAMKSNIAHGRDISDIADQELGNLAKLSDLMPAKPKDKSKMEFIGEKVQMNLDALKEFLKNLGQIFSRHASSRPKPA